jgi:hypothetical protein
VDAAWSSRRVNGRTSEESLDVCDFSHLGHLHRPAVVLPANGALYVFHETISDGVSVGACVRGGLSDLYKRGSGDSRRWACLPLPPSIVGVNGILDCFAMDVSQLSAYFIKRSYIHMKGHRTSKLRVRSAVGGRAACPSISSRHTPSETCCYTFPMGS